MKTYRRGELAFDVLDSGPADGPPVVFLHGFPQFNTSWTPVMDRLAAEGYRCVAPNQRGYGAGARPSRRRDYVVDELVADTVALFDALSAPRVHLVGHDWGGVVAWAAAALAPDRLASLTVLSTPHPAAFFQAVVSSRQFLASWYVYFFQLPRVPEWFLGRDAGEGLRRMMGGYAGQTPHAAERDATAIMASGALTAALNWYRALPLVRPRLVRTHVPLPTLYVWSDGDAALLETAARNTGNYVDAEYRFEIVRGATHWLPDQHPDLVAGLLTDWFGTHPIRGGQAPPTAPGPTVGVSG